MIDTLFAASGMVNPRHEESWGAAVSPIGYAMWDGVPLRVQGGVPSRAIDQREQSPGWARARYTTKSAEAHTWRPVELSGDCVDHDYRLAVAWWAWTNGWMPDGTYQVLGPTVAGNPHGLSEVALMSHTGVSMATPKTYRSLMSLLGALPFKGLVWHLPTGTVALRRSDVGLAWPIQGGTK